MLGEAQERVIGRPLQPFVQPADLAAFERLLDGGGRGEITLRGRRPAGGAAAAAQGGGIPGGGIPVFISLRPMPRDAGVPLLCGVLTDLTLQKTHLRELSEANAELLAQSAQREAAEEALRQSQKMEAVGQLTGGLAHDFNNLLTVIIGSLDMMQSGLEQGRTAGLERYAGTALASANRAAALTHRLLAFSRRQTLDPRRVSPNRLVLEMAELLQRTVGPMITLETVLPAGVGAILCDPNQLENALLNLAINARDAMPEGGRLTIGTARAEIGAGFAARHDMQPGAYVILSVTDTGTGMSADVAARAFDPFFTTKPIGAGTGLGLSMIYGFAKQSGGQVRIDSQEGHGATIRLYLPSNPDWAAEEEVAPPPPALTGAAGSDETVLVVDDEPVIRMLVAEVLRELGYTALEAAEGIAALQLLRAPGRIDLMVTDIGLPGGMNGRQLADAARVARPGLKVLFITGFAETTVMGKGGLEPGMRVMTKPFALDALAARIRAMIAGG
jgi:hypothetical protein